MKKIFLFMVIALLPLLASAQVNDVINNYPVYKTEYSDKALTLQTTWSEFSRYILIKTNKTSFDEWYYADCIEGDTDVDPENAMYVTPKAYLIKKGEYFEENGYQLKLYNFGNDIYGNDGTPPTSGYAQAETTPLGSAIYYPHGEGLNNHTFSWSLSKEEVEMLIKDKTGSVPVTRWICFAAKDSKMAPYSYIWVKMTIEITTAKEQQKFFYGIKNDNYWYHWNPSGILDNSQAMNGWSALVFDIQAPRDGYTIKDQKWNSRISNTLVANRVKIDGKSKYYFAPKGNIMITAQNGKVYTISPEGDSNQTTYNKLFSQNGNQFTWDEATLEDILNNNSIIYGGEGAGVFNNDILYATERTGKYTPIARLTQEQNASDYNSQMYAGTLELIHYLPVGSTYEDVLAGQAEENTVLYDVLNAIGYATRDPFDKDYSQYDINYSMSNLNRQLRAWIGYVKNDGNNVAQYVEQKQYDDDNKATFLVSWQRPINAYMEPFSSKTHEAYLYIIDYLRLYDWRGGKPNYGYMWDDNYWFWAYYNVKEISFDLRDAKTNLHQKSDDSWVYMDQVSTPIQLCPIELKNPGTGNAQVIPGSGDIGKYPFDLVDTQKIFTYSVNNDALKAYMGLNPVVPVNKAHIGGIYYKGNDEISESFSIIVPITVKYEWGSVTADFRINIENPNGTKPNTEVQNDLDPIVFDLSAPSSGTTVKDAGWKSMLNDTPAMYFVNANGSSKAYFATKEDLKVTAQNGKTYTLTPQDGSNKDTYDNTVLYAIDPSGNATPIVRLNNGQSTQELELIQRLPDGSENEVLYDVLNAVGYPGDVDRQLRAWIGYANDDGNTDTFLVSWNRPMNLNVNEPETIKEKEQYLYLIDYLRPYNWLGDNYFGRMYDDHYWQWACYNVKEIDVDLRPEKVMTNLCQPNADTWVPLSSVPTPMQLKTSQVENPGTAEATVAIGTADLGEYPFDLLNDGSNRLTYAVNNDVLKAYMGLNRYSEDEVNKARFGGIYFNRNGEEAKSSCVLVPVPMKKEWGSVSATMRINFGDESGNGDIDGDTKVTTADVAALANYLTGASTNISVEAADLNKDGKVDIADIVALVNLLITDSDSH